jgi:Uma2 family endonuclease
MPTTTTLADPVAPPAVPPRNGAVFARKVIGRMTFAEWVAFERTTDVKHELWDGEVVEVSGGTYEHNAICADLLFELMLRLRGTECEVLGSDQRVYISQRYGYYPDAVVVRGRAQVDFEEALRNPFLIAEVLSETTQATDRGQKYADYQSIESLRHYLLVDQYAPKIEHFARSDEGVWSLARTYEGVEETILLSMGDTSLEIPLQAVYQRVPFRAAPPVP